MLEVSKMLVVFDFDGKAMIRFREFPWLSIGDLKPDSDDWCTWPIFAIGAYLPSRVVNLYNHWSLVSTGWFTIVCRRLSTVLWDRKGIIFVDFLHERRTINAEYYCQILDLTKAAYCTKRRRSSIRNFVLLHGNARPQPAAITQAKLEEMHWEQLEHPTYSPNLSPCDYYLFGPLKKL
ncbi:hypothetical protein NQ318_009454 [Aromia moschata]|uniref:Transposase n=1 Tax=Aromia moschata TaxID=1265417 RepID=A0AAV8Z6Y0_9CUCU|nr:hypothetical protein NQ318_009454 [Aromia moschata]